MSVCVYIWTTNQINPGHASLEVGNAYISYWPTSENSALKNQLKNPPSKGNLKDFKIGVTHKVSFPSSYRVDCRLERKEADHKIILKKLDEALMQEQWKDFQKNPQRYNMQKSNCSTIVANFLELGSNLAYSHTPSISLKEYINDPKKLMALKLRFLGTTIQMWTPNDIRKYALQIKSVTG